MRFADRCAWDAQTNAIAKAQERLSDQGVELLDLTESNPTRCGFALPSRLLAALTRQENLVYEPSSLGLMRARRSVVDYYQRRGIACTPEQLVLTSSTSEAYSFLLRLLANPGDKVLVPRPSYPLFQFLLEINDVDCAYYPLVVDQGWRLDRASLLEQIDARTRAIILVNPNNPTGSFVSHDDLCFLNETAARHSLALISDEVFHDYAWGPKRRCSLAGNAGALTFTLSGLSKVLGLPQMKVAWILASGPQQALDGALSRLEMIADTYLSVNAPAQNAMADWLLLDGHMQGQIRQRVAANREVLERHLDQHVQVLDCEGGWYAVLKVPSVKSEEQWVLEFLNKDHVLAHPGYFFDFEREAYIVVSLLPEEKAFSQAISKVMGRVALSVISIAQSRGV